MGSHLFQAEPENVNAYSDGPVEVWLSVAGFGTGYLKNADVATVPQARQEAPTEEAPGSGARYASMDDTGTYPGSGFLKNAHLLNFGGARSAPKNNRGSALLNPHRPSNSRG